jgi:HlyD family secretion protein
VARIDKESDRVSEERRVYIACNQCPKNFHLGEQVEAFITTAVLDKALLIPQTAIQETSTIRGTVWTVEDGILRRRNVRLGHRTLDARVEILADLPEGTHVVSVLTNGLQEGRTAKIQNSNLQDKTGGAAS